MEKSTNIKNNGFKTPDNYFQNFNEEMQIHIIEENLKDRFGNKNPFTLPQDYFLNFSVEIEKTTKSAGKIIQLLKPYMSIAAGIILLFGLWQIVLINIDTNKNEIADINIVNENKTEILANNTLNFENIEITELNEMSENYIDEIDAGSIMDYTEEEIIDFEVDASEEEIEDYLIEYIDESDFDEILASL